MAVVGFYLPFLNPINSLFFAEQFQVCPEASRRELRVLRRPLPPDLRDGSGAQAHPPPGYRPHGQRPAGQGHQAEAGHPGGQGVAARSVKGRQS